MPQYDKRNKSTFRNGGARWSLQALLTAAEAAILPGGGTNTAGWYNAFYVQKTAVQRMLGRETIKDERGVIVANRAKTRDAKVKVTAMDTSTPTLKLLDLLAESPHCFRVAFDTADATKVQLFGLRNAFVVGDWSFEGEDGKDRTIEVEVQASVDDAGNPALVYDDVDVASETGWPAAMAQFKTDATP